MIEEGVLNAYVVLVKAKREVEESLKQIGKRIADYEAKLVGAFAEQGIQSVNCDGFTLYLKKVRHVRKLPDEYIATDQLAERLRNEGFEYLVSPTYSSATLKKVILEMIDNGEAIPTSIEECIEVSEETKLIAMKSD